MFLFHLWDKIIFYLDLCLSSEFWFFFQHFESLLCCPLISVFSWWETSGHLSCCSIVCECGFFWSFVSFLLCFWFSAILLSCAWAPIPPFFILPVVCWASWIVKFLPFTAFGKSWTFFLYFFFLILSSFSFVTSITLMIWPFDHHPMGSWKIHFFSIYFCLFFRVDNFY